MEREADDLTDAAGREGFVAMTQEIARQALVGICFYFALLVWGSIWGLMFCCCCYCGSIRWRLLVWFIMFVVCLPVIIGSGIGMNTNGSFITFFKSYM